MSIQGNRFLFSALLTVISAIFFLVACDNSFDPTDRDNGAYSVHGTLDLLGESSYIRVRDMNAPFTEGPTEELDAVVTLQNLDSGVNTTLDSRVREFEGVFLHTFEFDGDVLPDTRYLLRVENADGVQVELDTVTPTLPVTQIIRDNDACTRSLNLDFEPMNGGTLILRFGLEPDTPDRKGRWGRLLEFGPSSYTDRVSITVNPLRTAQGITASFGICSSLLTKGNLYVAIAHYSPGFYELLNQEVNDILKTTRRFGGFYADTLAIPVDTSQ